MTRVRRDTMKKEVITSVADDLNLSEVQNLEAEEEVEIPSMSEVFAGDRRQLVEQQNRLSVRDLASKFEKGLAGAGAGSKLSDEDKLRQAASMERHILLEKLRNALKSLGARVTGRNKDDVEETLSMVEALTVQLPQRDGELLEEKEQVKMLANFLKQGSEDAKKLVDEERAFTRHEIDSARAAVLRVEEALQELERNPRTPEKQGLEDLMSEVQEARRIKMLHESSKMMEMELELQALRLQLAEESRYSVQLQKELGVIKGLEENKFNLYELGGCETLGSYLWIIPSTDKAADLSKCYIQWYRISSDGSKKELISDDVNDEIIFTKSELIWKRNAEKLLMELHGCIVGATKLVYAPEPLDVGLIMQADIISNDIKVTVKTTGPIDPAPGLGSYIEDLVRITETEFYVVVSQMNGKYYPSDSVHVFHVGKVRIKLCKGRRITKAKESYSTSMQLCGIRGGGNAAVQSLFWQAKDGLSFVLAFESARARNAAIMLARRFAFDWSITLLGPGDNCAPMET